MAYLSKKNVKWNSEPVSMLTNSSAAYTQVAKTVIKSVPNSTNLDRSYPTATVACASTPPAEYVIPSLAPIAGQEVEVGVLTSMPQNTTVDMNVMYGQREQDRKVRREIANSNERRRMQSINAGFKALKTILPQTAGEKLSKAAVLQQTADYILQLDVEKTKLLTLNGKYRSALCECKCDNAKRRSLLSEGLDKDEGIGSPREEELEDFQRDSVEVRLLLEKERRLRMDLEKKIRELETRCRLLLDSCTLDTSANSMLVKSNSAPEVSTFTRLLSPKIKSEVETASCSEKTPLAPIAELHHQVVAKRISSSRNNMSTTTPYLCSTQHGKLPGTTMTKHTPSLPRSRQPLKKRAVEIVENDSPKTKMSRVQINSPTAANSPMNISPQTVLVQQPGKPPVLAVTDLQSNMSAVTVQTAGVESVSQEKLIQAAGILNIRPQMSHTEPLLLSATSSATPTYITVSPGSAVLSGTPVTWQPESQVALTAPNYSFAITPSSTPATHAQSQYVFHPTMHRLPPAAHTEEMTLNQLNTVPPLSMTLTQLNAVPTVARLNSGLPSSGAALPGNTRIQTHYLPVVAMDTVLSHTTDRRLSGTTDSAPSDEESKSTDDQHVLQIPTNLASASSRRTKSDPGAPLSDLHSKEVLCNPAASVLTHATLTTVTNGPGSPLFRQIDAAATRRNLETIVQAIDHLEQQERRNSQDHQTSNR